MITTAEQEAKKALVAAQDKLNAIQGFLDGKQIQQCWDNTWHDVEYPDFSCPYSIFRVKPDLVEGWINIYSEYRIGTWIHPSRETALKLISQEYDFVRVAHVREVEE